MAATSLDNQIVLFGADTFKQNVRPPLDLFFLFDATTEPFSPLYSSFFSAQETFRRTHDRRIRL
jgi:hypothetical protein